MRNIKNKLFIILIILFCINSTNAQHEVSKILIETTSGDSEICHETHNHSGTIYQHLTLRPTPAGKAVFIRENGMLELGSADVCWTTYQPDVYLAVDGAIFSTDSGFMRVASDKQLKKNIIPMSESLQKLMRVKLYNYEYKRGGKAKMGILAQEIKDLFPNSIHTFRVEGKEYYSVDYNDLFFTNIKSTQEINQKTIQQDEQIRTLAAENQNLRDKLEAQRKEIEAIKTALNLEVDTPISTTTETPTKPVTSTIEINIERDTPRLQQNVPNPFQRSTTIPYYLPEATQSATLLIHDMTGKTIAKHILLAQKGEGKIEVHIDDAQLRGSIYTYSLYVNDQLINTKTMTLLTK